MAKLELTEGESILRQNMGTYKGKGFFGTKNGTFYLIVRLNKGTNWLNGLPKGKYFINNRLLAIK
mgnify:CR=1 FL=1